MPAYKNLLPGDPAPWFKAHASSREDFTFDTTAGRYLVMCFFASASEPRGRAAVDAALAQQRFFDDEFASFFGVTIDPSDQAEKRVAGSLPGMRFLWDFDGVVSKLYGSVPRDAEPNKGEVQLRRMWIVIDPTLRVQKVIPFAEDGSDARTLEAYLESLPPPSRFAGFEAPAPILVLPNVFEPELCEKLVSLYEQHGGTESGFMLQKDGKTVLAHGHEHKRRSDYTIVDPELTAHIRQLFRRRLIPEILKAHQFKATRMERYLVACYSAEEGGHFRPHRDNTTLGTAHRRFAVSINLNDDFDGGLIGFPEYGPHGFKPPVGGAVVFSCSLLHTVSRMTRGRRYAFLPFLYDEEASRVRETNQASLADSADAQPITPLERSTAA